MESKSGIFLEKDKRILEELKNLHCDPHPFCTVLPSESDFSKKLMLFNINNSVLTYNNGLHELNNCIKINNLSVTV